MKYRKKPVVVDAVQITGEWFEKFGDMVNCDFDVCECYPNGGKTYYEINVPALHAELTASDGDYITMDKHGRMNVFNEAAFKSAYAPVSEDSAGLDKKELQGEINKLKADYADLEHECESLGESLQKSVEMVRWKREEIDQLKQDLGTNEMLVKNLRDENLALAYENAALKKEAQADRPCKASEPADEEKKAHSDLLDAFSYAYSQWEERAKGPNPGCRCTTQPYFGECKCADKDAEIAELKAKVDSLSRSLRTEKSASEVQRVRLYTEIETLTEKNADMKRTLDFFGLPV